MSIHQKSYKGYDMFVVVTEVSKKIRPIKYIYFSMLYIGNTDRRKSIVAYKLQVDTTYVTTSLKLYTELLIY